MSESDRNAGSPDQQQRIADLKERARQVSGGEMTCWESPALSDDSREAFWRRVMAFEEEPSTTLLAELARAGVQLPPPEGLTDEQVTAKLWEVLEALAKLGVFLDCTNHLSDRALYTLLLREELPQETSVPEPAGMQHILLGSSGSEEDTRVFLKYYADERTRQDWIRDFPDFDVPPHADPPYDRDRYLPPWEEHLPRRSQPVGGSEPAAPGRDRGADPSVAPPDFTRS